MIILTQCRCRDCGYSLFIEEEWLQKGVPSCPSWTCPSVGTGERRMEPTEGLWELNPNSI